MKKTNKTNQAKKVTTKKCEKVSTKFPKYEPLKLKKLTKKDLDNVRQKLTKIGTSEKDIDAIIKDLKKHADK